MSDTPTIALKLKPWEPPNYATVERPPGKRDEGFKELPGFHVTELSQDALDGLARQWLADLYAKADKPNGWEIGRVVAP